MSIVKSIGFAFCPITINLLFWVNWKIAIVTILPVWQNMLGWGMYLGNQQFHTTGCFENKTHKNNLNILIRTQTMTTTTKTFGHQAICLVDAVEEEWLKHVLNLIFKCLKKLVFYHHAIITFISYLILTYLLLQQ